MQKQTNKKRGERERDKKGERGGKSPFFSPLRPEVIQKGLGRNAGREG